MGPFALTSALVLSLGWVLVFGVAPHAPVPGPTTDVPATPSIDDGLKGAQCWRPVFAGDASDSDIAGAMAVLSARAAAMGIGAAEHLDPAEIALTAPLPDGLWQRGQVMIAEVLEAGALPSAAIPEGALTDASGREWLLPGAPIAADGRLIVAAYPVDDMTRAMGVNIELSAQAAVVLGDLTERLAAQTPPGRVVIALDGVALTAPTVMMRIDGGAAQITGHMTSREAAETAAVLAAGPLPVQITDVSGPVPCGDWIETTRN
ncbi:MAG: hypothetical protein CSA72_04430 [Rhodobacterales bacterium]|nr:MAG: hypothetical protein CSA72_04430 [Rhodobacterales bacterium]